ncbi:hypothetical protein GGD81_002479 [Rhodobium orientis]|uniref:Uncharacterized protein n=1 Tax=Rhodobium orientis TaxID=34017 RepID=A0A327JJQ5_9HYPH|nr:hypothetical protein [Rhodobium orientis]MBB4303436.1 hypothetical protein [Rhodobium orientis]MBK5950370.1 hypothetical protein [Rhodobium orientis]RAI25022.1 hypothetical protein CH339_19990 [Rhodobium orientis]
MPKFDDGTPLLTNKLWAIYVTDTSLYGLTMDNGSGTDFSFVWRADKGLVLEHEDKKTYEKLVSEAGEANPGLGSGSLGAQVVMREYMKNPQYAGQRCPTNLVTW